MPDHWKPNVTVAAVIEDGGRYLLVEEHTPEGLTLNNPAGHLEPGESPEHGAVREALEETSGHFVPDCFLGLYLSRFKRPATGEDVTYLRIAFGGKVSSFDTGRALDEGIVRTVWMTLDEVRQSSAHHRSALVLRCIEDHASGVRHPLNSVFTDPSIYNPEIKG